jgi:hypothetical protein
VAQVNSSPGQNQVFGTVAVVPAISEVGTVTATKTIATLTTVSYSQSEPGKPISNVNTKRN